MNHPPKTIRVSDSPEEFRRSLDQFQETFRAVRVEIQRAIVGYDDLISDVLVALFSQGNVLLEGVPGLGKTFLVKLLSQVFGLTFGRVQCTPDLMPADVLGTHYRRRGRKRPAIVSLRTRPGVPSLDPGR